MSSHDLLALYEQQVRSLRRRPWLGRASARASARLAGDTSCEVRHGSRVTCVELPSEEGGGETAPHPGELMRASLGACLALSYRLWSARLGIPLVHVEVDVTCEFDARGPLGIAEDATIGWQRVLFDVRIESELPRSDVQRVVAHADRLNPLLANLHPELVRIHRLLVSPPSAQRLSTQPRERTP